MKRDEILFCSVGAGWRALLETVLAQIPAEDIIQVKEKFGQLDINVVRPRLGEPASVHRERLKFLAAVFDQSALVCEDCGAPAHPRAVGGYWRKTLCDRCAVARLA